MPVGSEDDMPPGWEGWSRGGELSREAYPELYAAIDKMLANEEITGTILDQPWQITDDQGQERQV